MARRRKKENDKEILLKIQEKRGMRHKKERVKVQKYNTLGSILRVPRHLCSMLFSAVLFFEVFIETIEAVCHP